MSLAIVPGSFDPMTLGHLDIVECAAARYDEVVVAVMINAEKSYFFDMDTRVKIAQRTVSSLKNVSVMADSGMLIDLFDRLGADVVCKGVRNDADRVYEERMAEWNLAHNPRFRTEMLPANAQYTTLSSTQVREWLKEGRSLAGLLHPDAIPLVLQAEIKNGGRCDEA